MYAVMVSVAKKVIVFFSEVQEGVVITLDGAQTLFISSDELVFSLKGEKMWVHQIKCNAEIDIYVGFDGLVEM